MKLDAFTRAYITAALWSSTDEYEEPMDANYDASDIAEECMERIVAECIAFQDEFSELLAEIDSEQAGHDFWLTRNGHGCGFWCRGYPKALGDVLTEASKMYGECYLYVGDDNAIYCG